MPEASRRLSMDLTRRSLFTLPGLVNPLPLPAEASLEVAEQVVRELQDFVLLRFLPLVEEQLVVWLRHKAEELAKSSATAEESLEAWLRAGVEAKAKERLRFRDNVLREAMLSPYPVVDYGGLPPGRGVREVAKIRKQQHPIGPSWMPVLVAEQRG